MPKGLENDWDRSGSWRERLRVLLQEHSLTKPSPLMLSFTITGCEIMSQSILFALSYLAISLLPFHCSNNVLVSFLDTPAWCRCHARRHSKQRVCKRKVIVEVPGHRLKTSTVALQRQNVKTFFSRIKCVHPKPLRVRSTEFLQTTTVNSFTVLYPEFLQKYK